MVDSTSENYDIFTFSGVDVPCLLDYLGLIYLGGGLDGEFILYFFVGVDRPILLLVLLCQPKSSRPCQFLQVVYPVVLAAQHRRVGGGCPDVYLLSLVDQVEPSDHFLITFQSESTQMYIPSVLMTVIVSSMRPVFS